MIRDPMMPDGVAQLRYDQAVADREFYRARYHEEIRSYNAVVEDRDNMLEELAFLRTQLGEARWLELAEKYERLNREAIILKAGCVKTGGAA
jgi:hypothetical protein